MSAALNLGLVVALVAGLVAAMAALRRIAEARGWHPELPRKIVHVGAGGLATALPWLMAETWQVWLLLGLTAAAMVALRLPVLRGAGGALHGVARRSWGDFLLVAAVALTFLLHDGRAILYVLPLVILTLGDAAAALAGVRYGRAFYTTEDGRKSFEGSAMFFLVALILGMVCLLLLTEIPRENVIVIATAVAAFATLVEADSWQGLDNLFLPMGVLIFLWATIDAPAAEAALRTVTVIAAAAAIFAATRWLGLSTHVARVNASALFLLLTVLYPVNAILPAILLLAPAAMPSAPGRNAEALASVAVLAAVSFAYLAVEPAFGRTAINFHGLAVAGLAAAQFGLAAAMRRGWALPLALLAAAGLAALWRAVTAAAPDSATWHDPIIWPGVAAIALAALLPALRPGMFERQRSVRLALLGAGPATVLLSAHLLVGASA